MQVFGCKCNNDNNKIIGGNEYDLDIKKHFGMISNSNTPSTYMEININDKMIGRIYIRSTAASSLKRMSQPGKTSIV